MALRHLQRGLTGERQLAGEEYFSEAEYLGAYLLYYWPISYLQTWCALRETLGEHGLPGAGRVLDLGAGPGPASFAALELGASSLLLVDASEPALVIARSLAKMAGTESLETVGADLSADFRIPEGPFDLIIASHSMNELWKGEDSAPKRRADLLARAAEKLSPEGILLVIEPSALATSVPALQVRDILLDPRNGYGLRCIAPCPASIPCPALLAGNGRTCHSTWAWKPLARVSALAAQAGLDRDSVKATWFTLGLSVSDKSPAAGAAPGEDRLRGRIISEPMLNKAGRIRYIVCTATGLATFSAPADAPWTKKSGMSYLRRGDMIDAGMIERRTVVSSFGLLPSSSLEITRRAATAGGSNGTGGPKSSLEATGEKKA